MKQIKKVILVLGIMFAALSFSALAAPNTAYAAEETSVTEEAEEKDDNALGSKAIAAAIAIALASAGGAVGMGLSIAKSAEGIARQPEAEGKIRTTLMLGLVFIETAIIYALIIAILIIFVM